jgi:hypothetical protein
MSQLLQGLTEQMQKPMDDIPARLTENEFVIPADVVLIIGQGDAKAGANQLQQIVDQIRASVQQQGQM